jgi:hypothetical protein
MLETALGLLLGFVSKFLLGWLAQRDSNKFNRELGRVENQRDNATATLKKQQEIQDAAPVTEDSLRDALGKGEA